MVQLTRRDLRNLLSFVEEIYAPRDLNAFLLHLVTNLSKLVPTMLVGVAEMIPGKKTSVNLFHPSGINTPEIDLQWQKHMHEHPVLAYGLQTRDGQAYKISDFLSELKFGRSGLYNEVYKKMGVGDNLCFDLLLQSSRVIGIGIHRERMNFTERERRMVNLARPHLVQAWHNARAFSKMQRTLTSLYRAFEEIDHGVVVLDRRQRVRVMTPLARQTISKYFGNTARVDSRLPEELASWVRREQSQNGEKEIAKPRMPLIRECEDGHLCVRLLIHSGESLLLLEEAYKRSFGLSKLTGLGLTEREAEVLAWIAGGKTNSEIASILRVSRRTVQKHLEHIFEKLGVENRTAAAAHAFRVKGN